jgi:hypothetical protein
VLSVWSVACESVWSVACESVWSVARVVGGENCVLSVATFLVGRVNGGYVSVFSVTILANI